MANGEDSNKDTKPAQIPLLKDVVGAESGSTRQRRSRTKPNLDLNLNPDPPRTRDLFSGALAPIAYHGAADHAGQSSQTAAGSNRLIDAGRDANAESAFRDQANELVDRFVTEYSDEILKRLRTELTALLEDLDK